MVGEEPRATRLEQAVPPEQVTEEVATDASVVFPVVLLMARPTPIRLTEAMPVILPDSVAAMIRAEFPQSGRRPMGMVS